jgi:2-keto-4-pentenoate hydratase
MSTIERLELSLEQIEQLGLALYEAEQTARPIAPLTTEHPGLTVEQAYAIQQVLMGKRLENHKIVGRKVGLTSKAMQQLLGVDQPDFGLLLDDMQILDGGNCPVNELIQPKVEPEIAFVMAQDLSGPNLSAEQVLAATAYVVPALEIVDSRIINWQIKLADTVADNASSSRFVLGSSQHPPEAFDLRLMGMLLWKNGELIETGAGAAALGHPANAVAWLGNKLAEFGAGFKAGEVVLPGALCKALAVERGDEIKAEFYGIGAVSVRFV